ncbi:MAG: nucleotidyl transferase AbiEii/AbiGii toxin family protein, partial [Acidobacteriaceae bacterium]
SASATPSGLRSSRTQLPQHQRPRGGPKQTAEVGQAKLPNSVHATIQATKVSFLGYAYPLLFPTNPFLEVAVADPRDIACMKVSAIAGRGTKRDFVDLYLCAKQYGLKEILQLFYQKYAQTHYSGIHILKSLTFFGDAEKDPMPHMLVTLDWDTVKQFFLRETPRLL